MMYRCCECGHLFEDGEHGKKLMGLIHRRMRSGADAPFARATMRKSTSAKNVEIGIQKMNYMTDCAKSACAKPSTTTHSLSIARRTRTITILTRL